MNKTNIYYVTYKGVTRNAKGQSFALIENTIVYAENIEDAIKTLKDFWKREGEAEKDYDEVKEVLEHYGFAYWIGEIEKKSKNATTYRVKLAR